MKKILVLFIGVVCFCTLFSARAENTASINESKVFMTESCFTSPPDKNVHGSVIGGALIGAIAQPLINGLVDLGAATIKKAATDKTVSFPIAGPETEKFYSVSALGSEIVNSNIRCITLISGNFTSKARLETDMLAPHWLNNALKRIIGYEDGRLIGNTSVYFEAEIVRSDDKKHFSLSPRAIYIGDFIQSSIWNNERNFEINLEFQDIASNTPYAKFVFNFAGVTKGFARANCKLLKIMTGCDDTGLGVSRAWFQMQPQTDEMKKIQIARKSLAAKLGLLSTPIGKVGAREIDANADAIGTSAHKSYCEKLERNKASQYKSEETCPPEFYRARVEAMYQAALIKSRLEYVDAVLLYREICMGDSKNDDQKKKRAAELAALREPYYRQFPLGLTIETEDSPGVNALENGLDVEKHIVACLEKNKEIPIGQFMLTGTVKETKLGSAFAKWLSPVVESAAPDIKTTLQNQLIPAKRKAIEDQEDAVIATKAAATRDAKFSMLVADNAVSIAEIELSAAQAAGNDAEIKKSELVLLQKKYAANNAYRTAGVPIPHPDVP